MSREKRRRWLLCVGLTWAGVLVTIAGVVFGVWVQFHLPPSGGVASVWFRLSETIQSLVPVGVGLLVIGVAQILGAMQMPSAPATFE
jgi:hypothetical protein